MRLIVSVLACVAVGGLSAALADPSAPNSPATPTTPAAAATSAVPAAAAPAAATPAAADTTGGTPAHSANATATPAPAIDPREKHLLSQGYKPQMVKGERVFCKREAVMGSRTETVSHCGTVDQLASETRLSREATENSQRIQLPSSGH
jgi:hypothetical protein